MPVTQDIRDAIERGDAHTAQALFKEVLAKNNGGGLSGHDQQILQSQIDRLRKQVREEAAEEREAAAAVEAEVPHVAKRSSRAAKMDPSESVFVSAE